MKNFIKKNIAKFKVFLKNNFTKKLIIMRIIYFSIAFLIVFIPSLSLNLAFLGYADHTQISNGGFISVLIEHNEGMAFSALDNNPSAAACLQVFICLILVCVMLSCKKWWYVLTLSLAITGSMFNIFDRAAHGWVLDYFSFSFKPFNNSVWNFPDASILTGIISFALLTIIFTFIGIDKDDKKYNKNKDEKK